MAINLKKASRRPLNNKRTRTQSLFTGHYKNELPNKMRFKPGFSIISADTNVLVGYYFWQQVQLRSLAVLAILNGLLPSYHSNPHNVFNEISRKSFSRMAAGFA